MIPILYEGTEKRFLTNGLGRLADAISCKVTEERNGSFELEMTYPITGAHYSDIKEDKIIFAKTSDLDNNQAFIIYKISKPLNGVVTINAQHISYLLNGFPVMPFTAANLADAFSKIQENIVVEDSPFVFETTISSSVGYTLSEPKSARSVLGGENGSILDVYGGYDYEFDNFRVSLKADRGNDNGVTIRHGKNLTALQSIIDTTNVYTGVVPFWKDSEGNAVYLTEKAIYSEHASDYPYKIAKPVDFSSDFETAPTEAQLRSRATSYLNNNRGWRLKNSIDISFVSLSQTEEYKGILKSLERVKLCDTVTVIYDELGVNLKIKVIKTVFNTLTERYDSISLGDTTYTLAKAISEALDTPSNAQTQAEIQSAVSRATKLIQGGLGGFVVFNTNGNGQPQEILIMDSDNIEEAVSVIRMNKNGIGFSRNGYSGPYTTAWTIDGHFVADFIDTGELNGQIIKAGTLLVNAFSEEAKSELDLIHNYLPYDIFSNLARWEYNAHAVTLETYIVDEETYDCMTMDGREIASYTPSYQTQVQSDYMGQPTVDVKFDYIFKNDVTITTQQFFYFYYKGTDGLFHTSYWNIVSGNYLKDTIYTFTVTDTFSHNVDPSYSPKIGFRFIPNVETCITNFTVTGLKGDYEKSTLKFTATGLDSVVQKGSVISSINQSAESVSIKAEKIDLTGNLNLHGNFTTIDPTDSNVITEVKYGYLKAYNSLNGQQYQILQIGPAGVTERVYGVITLSSSDGNETKVRATDVTTPKVTTDELVVNGDATYFSGGALKVFCTARFYDDVYNVSGSTVFVSDKRKKKNIKDLTISKAKSFLMNLKPRSFKFKDGQSGRNHHGFIAQEVKEAMPEDWGLYVEDKEKDFIGLRYDEIIADAIKLLQDHEKRIEKLEGGSKE